MLRACYGHGLTRGTIIQMFYHGLDGPTQGILDAGGIFLYNTPNEAFQNLKDKALKPLVSAVGSRKSLDARRLITPVDGEIEISFTNPIPIPDRKGERSSKEMRDGSGRTLSQIYHELSRSSRRCVNLMEEDDERVDGYVRNERQMRYDDRIAPLHIPYTDAKTFADVVLLNHVGKKEFKLIVGDGIGVKKLMNANYVKI
ncbi:hypothetical protein Tco_0925028 [Tanacetum coccineum]|uniref:DNA-directed RNA polymerase n=1 Tax=Tanacetum coccineum TaxID=301880 RepID=A0ABQ5D6Q5_9ASTR